MRVTAAMPFEFRWIAERTGVVPTANARALKAVDAAGRIRGMVLYENWTPNSVQAHMAVDTPIAWRTLVGPAFAYPFDECGRGLLLAIVSADNPRSLSLVRRFGFTEQHRVRDGWAAGVDLILFEMRRADCRWLAGHERKAA